MTFCTYCEGETIAGAQMVQDGGAIRILDCCTSCGKPYKQQRTIDSMPEDVQKAKPVEAKPQEAQPQAKVVTHPATASNATSILEQARARLVQVDAELLRMQALRAERATLRRIVRATKGKP